MKENKVRAIERAFDIIECFTYKEQELTLVEITKKTNLALATVHRNIQTLLSRGYLEQDKVSGKYRLGIQFVRISGIVIQGFDLIQKATPHLHQLSKETELNINLSIYDAQGALCLVNLESFHNFGFEIKVGQKMPIYAGALSKVLLAYLPDEEIESLTSDLKTYTPLTISQKEELIRDLKEIRKVGISKSEGELALGAIAYAAPVFNFENRMVAGISITGPKQFFTDSKKKKSKNDLLHTAEEISRDLGYENTNSFQRRELHDESKAEKT